METIIIQRNNSCYRFLITQLIYLPLLVYLQVVVVCLMRVKWMFNSRTLIMHFNTSSSSSSSNRNNIINSKKQKKMMLQICKRRKNLQRPTASYSVTLMPKLPPYNVVRRSSPSVDTERRKK